MPKASRYPEAAPCLRTEADPHRSRTPHRRTAPPSESAAVAAVGAGAGSPAKRQSNLRSPARKRREPLWITPGGTNQIGRNYPYTKWRKIRPQSFPMRRPSPSGRSRNRNTKRASNRHPNRCRDTVPTSTRIFLLTILLRTGFQKNQPRRASHPGHPAKDGGNDHSARASDFNFHACRRLPSRWRLGLVWRRKSLVRRRSCSPCRMARCLWNAIGPVA